MFPLRRSSSFSAYSYESDDDENDNDPDCWCLCDDENDDDDTKSKEQHSKDGEIIVVNETTLLVAENQTSPTNHSRPYQRRESKSRLMVLGSMCVLIVVTIILQPDVRTREENMASVSILGQTRTTKSTTTNYGEVWLIRHGEKDDTPLLVNDDTSNIMRTMYELNAEGWDRAHHLVSLVQQDQWPKFSALVASRPPTKEEAKNAYPDFARDGSGQSMVWREYQTLMPLAEHLAVSITAEYTKGQVEAAGLDIAQKAVGLARDQSLKDTRGISPIVLVSWDHCSLPTLVVHGLGCRNDPRCFRCWGDDRFGDVLKLNVTLVTTTKTRFETTESRIVVHRDYQISSTILSMTGEAYPGDDYHVLDKNSSSSLDDIILDASTHMSIEESTPCKNSYCTNRAAAKDLVSCTCWDSTGKPRKLLLPSETIGQGG